MVAAGPERALGFSGTPWFVTGDARGPGFAERPDLVGHVAQAREAR